MPLFLTVSIVCAGIGFFIYRNPQRTITLQQKFYEKINWRMEPISLKKEIRNTKMMGLFLVIFVIGAFVYYFILQK